MMNTPLLINHLFDYSMQASPNKEIVTRTTSGSFRYTYADFGRRTRQLSSALAQLGVQRGERVGTFAWNDHRHLEAYFAIPCMGAVLHTINIRLFPDQIAYIINHAEDRVLLVDPSLLPVLESIRDRLTSVQAYVVFGEAADVPETTLSPVYAYEELLRAAKLDFAYPTDLDENAPMGMCYTSATTGNPKGVVYTHRGIYLHSMALGLANTIGLSEADTAMPIVPMFHANAWGLPFAAVWFGAKIVFPGSAPTPSALLDLMADEGVTLAAGVPTVWLGILRELEQRPQPLKLSKALCGGSAAPKALIRAYEEKYGITFMHAYGMTETSPLATVARLKSRHMDLPFEQRLDFRSTQGYLVPGLEMRLVGDQGDIPWDGQQFGELLLRGPWIADSYYNDERSKDTFVDGWLHTGDVVTIDSEGFVRLVDRTKDLVKSGGEWISSVDLENALMAHPAVFEAAVVGVPHPKWHERPLAFVVLKNAAQATPKTELLDFLRDRFSKWWIPDDVIFLSEVPKTSVGKFMKRTLREQYRDYWMSADEES